MTKLTSSITTTTNLSNFGYLELTKLTSLLLAMRAQGLPDEFNTSQVHPMMNKNSGCVFLTNEDYQVAMLNGDTLEMFYSCPECGHEGFKEDFNIDDECEECARIARDE